MTLANQAFLYRYHVNLRRVDFPLGIADYLIALRLVEQGYGLADHEELYRLCRLIWLKSERQESQFRHIFEATLTETRQAIADAVMAEARSQEQSLHSAKYDGGDSREKSGDFRQNEESRQSTDQPTDKNMSEITAVHEGETHISLPKPTTESPTARQFLFQPTQLPITLRQMKQLWRYLRRYQRRGRATELDFEATLAAISTTGHFLSPILRPPRTNQARLLLLLDHSGSMVPFHLFSHLLAESAKRGGRLQQTGVYYFHDVPYHHLYRDMARLDGVELSQLCSTLAPNTLVMIFSDAGAARRHYEVERILQTQRFLEGLRPQVQRLVWLNPLPQARWPESSAAEIARLVPMFELSRVGLDAAITALNGQGHYWEQQYPWMH